MPRDGLAAPSIRRNWIEGDYDELADALRQHHSAMYGLIHRMAGAADSSPKDIELALGYLEDAFEALAGDRLKEIRREYDEEIGNPDHLMKRSVGDIIA